MIKNPKSGAVLIRVTWKLLVSLLIVSFCSCICPKDRTNNSKTLTTSYHTTQKHKMFDKIKTFDELFIFLSTLEDSMDSFPFDAFMDSLQELANYGSLNVAGSYRIGNHLTAEKLSSIEGIESRILFALSEDDRFGIRKKANELDSKRDVITKMFGGEIPLAVGVCLIADVFQVPWEVIVVISKRESTRNKLIPRILLDGKWRYIVASENKVLSEDDWTACDFNNTDYYEYTCLKKREFGYWLISFPYTLSKGLELIKIGKRLLVESNTTAQEMKESFTDLLHTFSMAQEFQDKLVHEPWSTTFLIALRIFIGGILYEAHNRGIATFSNDILNQIEAVFWEGVELSQKYNYSGCHGIRTGHTPYFLASLGVVLCQSRELNSEDSKRIADSTINMINLIRNGNDEWFRRNDSLEETLSKLTRYEEILKKVLNPQK